MRTRELRLTALRAIARSLKASFETSMDVPRTKITYYNFKTALGQRAFGIITRNNKPEHRYPLGIRPELFPHVNYFAIYLDGEPKMSQIASDALPNN